MSHAYTHAYIHTKIYIGTLLWYVPPVMPIHTYMHTYAHTYIHTYRHAIMVCPVHDAAENAVLGDQHMSEDKVRMCVCVCMWGPTYV